MQTRWSQLALSIITSTFCLAALADPPILLTKVAIQKTNVTKSDVIIIGDTNHTLPSLRNAVTQSLSDFKQASPSLDCLFLEADARMQPALDAYAKSAHPDYEGTIVTAHVETLSPLEKSGVVKTNSGTPFTKTMLNVAKKDGIRVIAADIDYSSSLGDKIQSASMMISLGVTDQKILENAAKIIADKRSEIFAEKILKAKKAGLCHQSLVVIGIAHMTKTFGNIPVITIQDRLKIGGLTTSNLAVISGGCDTDPHPDQQKKSICSGLKQGRSYSAMILERSSEDDPFFAILAR